jgi:hypothetical protein
VPDYIEVLNYQANQPKRGPTPAQLAAHEKARHAFISRMQELVAASPWDTLKAHLGALVEEDEARVKAIQQQMLDGELTGDVLSKALLRMQRIQGRIEARKEDIEFPGTVIAIDEEDRKAMEGQAA